MMRILNSALATSIAAATLATILAASTASAALSFTTLTLINGWTKYDSTVNTPGVALDSTGVVHLRGGIKTSGTNLHAFNLPANFRPNKLVYVVTNLCGADPGRLIIDVNGSVSADYGETIGDAQCFTSLDGVTFAR